MSSVMEKFTAAISKMSPSNFNAVELINLLDTERDRLRLQIAELDNHDPVEKDTLSSEINASLKEIIKLRTKVLSFGGDAE